MRVAALYVDKTGPYAKIKGVDAWDEGRDARRYKGPHPVIAHPPCKRWGNFWNAKGQKLGDDGGCFEKALLSVRKHGGVLEHPRGSRAWQVFGLPKPSRGRWRTGHGLGFAHKPTEWVTEIDQACYGHRARKATWLLYVGSQPPPPLIWKRGNHAIEFRKKKGRRGVGLELAGRRERELTPPALVELLVALARHSRSSCEG